MTWGVGYSYYGVALRKSRKILVLQELFFLLGFEGSNTDRDELLPSQLRAEVSNRGSKGITKTVEGPECAHEHIKPMDRI